MNRLVLFLALLPFASYSQGSWVNVEVQTDQYSAETTWDIVGNGEVWEESAPYFSNEFRQQVVFLPPGDYTFTVYDAFGDGICCSFGEGWFGLSNSCGLDTAVYDFNSSSFQIEFSLYPCPPPIFGCMSPGALDFNPWATMPGPCNFPPQQCEEGENNIVVTVVPDTYAGETSWDIMTFPEGDIVLDGGGYTAPGIPVITSVCLPIGSEFKVNVYDAFGDGMCGSCYGGVDGHIAVTTLCGELLYYIGDTLQFESEGSDIITVGNCQPEIPSGCTDPWFTEYDPLAIVDDGTCETEVIYGCTDSLAVNYNPDANTLETENNCEFVFGLTDGAGDGWFGSWIGVVQGDEIFGPFTMTPDDGVEKQILIPLYSGESIEVLFFTGGNAETTASQCGFYFEGPHGVFMEGGENPWTDPLKKFPYRYTGTPLCDDFCEAAIEGCVEEDACNFNPDANVESECTFPIEYYDCNNNCLNDADEDGICDELEIIGCQDPTAFNYDASATDPGECEEVVFGCTDPTQFNYNPLANTDNGGCVPFIYGCMDTLALNYDEDANTELEDSCIPAIPGCMDLDAFNFDPDANVADNENCLYDAGCVTGPGEPYWANDYCYLWVIEVDPYCCEEGWDGVCEEMYSYCSDGVTNVSEYNGDVEIYPNPTNGSVYIRCPHDYEVIVYSMMGREVSVEVSNNRVDLTGLPNSAYRVIIKYEGRIIKKTVIKQ